MTINRVYQHNENKRWYILLWPCKVKNQETREWEDVYVYRRGGDREIYVRTVKDFEEKFTEHNAAHGKKFIGPQLEMGMYKPEC